jgi:predicted amidohydrolase
MATRTVLATVNRGPAAGGVDSAENLARLMADTEPWVQRAARMGARMLAFTEVYPQLRHPGEAMYSNLEPWDGGSLLGVIDLARKYDIDIVWPRFERHPDGLRNASIYVSRKGEVLGRYFKMFPTIGEMDKGIIPGAGAVCVEAEFGRVGFAICFDLNFIELRDAYRPLRPDVVVFSSMYRGGITVQSWAVDLGAYMVSSYGCELGRIVDRGGRILAMATYEALATAEVNLNSVQMHMDYNWGKMDEMLAKYGTELRFDYYTQEAVYVVSSTTVPIREIMAEFKLWDIQDYFGTARQKRRDILAGRAGG